MTYTETLKTPFNQLFTEDKNSTILESKFFYKMIPSLLSGNKPANKIINLIPFLKPEIEEVLFDLAAYALLSHYSTLSNKYDPILKNHGISSLEVRDSTNKVFPETIPDFYSFVEKEEGEFDISLEYNDKVSSFIKKAIHKACTLDNPNNAQYFSTTITILHLLSSSKNPIIQEKADKFFKNLPENMLLSMLIINKIGNENNLNTILQSQTKASIFSQHILSYQNEEFSDHKKSVLQFISSHNKYSMVGVSHIIDFLASHSSSIIFKNHGFHSSFKELNEETQNLLWNHPDFKEKIALKLNNNHFLVIQQLKKSFTSAEIKRDPQFNSIHNIVELSPTITANENTVSYKIYYPDYFSVIINNNHGLNKEEPNEEIITSLNFLSSVISMYLLKKNYIDEFSETEHKNRNNPTRNGVTLSFTNQNMEPDIFENFIINVMSIVSMGCKKQLSINILNHKNLPRDSGIYPIIDTYYEEAIILSQVKGLPEAPRLKPLKF